MHKWPKYLQTKKVAITPTYYRFSKLQKSCDICQSAFNSPFDSVKLCNLKVSLVFFRLKLMVFGSGLCLHPAAFLRGSHNF